MGGAAGTASTNCRGLLLCRDVGLEAWSWSPDRSRPLFEVLVLAAKDGLKQDQQMTAKATENAETDLECSARN